VCDSANKTRKVQLRTACELTGGFMMGGKTKSHQ